jgi:hypothetical protein
MSGAESSEVWDDEKEDGDTEGGVVVAWDLLPCRRNMAHRQRKNMVFIAVYGRMA